MADWVWFCIAGFVLVVAGGIVLGVVLGKKHHHTNNTSTEIDCTNVATPAPPMYVQQGGSRSVVPTFLLKKSYVQQWKNNHAIDPDRVRTLVSAGNSMIKNRLATMNTLDTSDDELWVNIPKHDIQSCNDQNNTTVNRLECDNTNTCTFTYTPLPLSVQKMVFNTLVLQPK
jgi:hypothetical protein